jgi:hypothetical protein
MLYIFGFALLNPILVNWDAMNAWVGISMTIGIAYYLKLKGWILTWYSGDWWVHAGERVGEKTINTLFLIGCVFVIIGGFGWFLTDHDYLFQPLWLVGTILFLIMAKIIHSMKN